MSDVKRFLAPVNDTCDMNSYQMVVLASDYAALEAENARLRAGQESVGEAQLKTGGGISLLHVDLSQPLPPGTKLYTAPQPSAELDGWKLVPVEPTEEMLESDFISCHCGHDFSPALFDHVWHKMLAAAPSAPATVPSVNQQLLEALEAAEKKLCIAEYHLDKGEDDSVVFESEILLARAAIAAARKGEGA